jgi:hypothetical protein
MNTHPVTNRDVMAYLDGELPPEAAAGMTAHLTQCRACQELAADLQGVSRHLSGWTVEAVDAETVIPANIASALATQAAARTKWHPSVWSRHFVVSHRWAVSAVALIVSVAALIWLSPNRVGSHITTSKADLIVSESSAPVQMDSSAPAQPALIAKRPPEPVVVRTAELRLTAHNFDTVRTDLDRILSQFGGHIAQLNVTSPTGEARSLTATLRIPSPQLESALAELRKLGHVDSESQNGEEVTQQSVDLEARLNNAHHTEERLTEILRTRTGKLSEVLEVEQKLAEVRGEIERAEAEQKSLNNRVSFATVSLQATEDYRAPLTGGTASSVGTRLNNAAVDGLHTAFNGMVGLVQSLLATGPSLLLWGLILGLPVYFLWKKLRH